MTGSLPVSPSRSAGPSGRSGPEEISDPQRLDHQPCGRRTRVLLMPGDQIAVAYGVRLEGPAHDEVGVVELLRLVLDPERLDPPSDEFVRGALFGVGEPGPDLAF